MEQTDSVGRSQWDGRRLKEIREERRLSQVQLSKLAGVSEGEISRHERNAKESNPTIDVIFRLAHALSINVPVLLDPVGATIPRPEEQKAGRAGRAERNPVFEELLEALDDEMPAEDSWRGDVLKAVAALNRALRRHRDSSEAPAAPQKTGR